MDASKVASFIFSPTMGMVVSVIYAALCEYLAHNPKYAANSTAQAIKNGLGLAKDKLPETPLN